MVNSYDYAFALWFVCDVALMLTKWPDPECIRQMFPNRKCYVCLKIIGFMYGAGIVNNFEVQSVFMTQSQKAPVFFIQEKFR